MLPFSFHGAQQGFEREPAADEKEDERDAPEREKAGEPAGKAQASPPEPHRSNPAFGTIAILKGNPD